MLRFDSCTITNRWMMDPEPEDGKKESQPGIKIGAGIAIGAGIGAALGVAMDNIAVGIAIGIAIGAAIGSTMQQHGKERDDDE